MSLPDERKIESILRARILDEIGAALGLPRTGRLRYLIRPWLWLPASRFARIAARFEAQVPGSGLPGGARQMCADLSLNVTLCGQPDLPAQGPVLVVSNHPGAYDSIAIVARIPRPDLKVLVSDVPFFRALPHTSQRFIFVPPGVSARMGALRSAVEHLKAGGTLMLFPYGDVEPDPAFMPGAREAIGDWSPSVEVLLRKVPQAVLQIVIASNVLLPQFVHSPVVRIRRKPEHQQKLAEFIQVIQQLLLPRSLESRVRLSFDRPVRVEELASSRLMTGVIARARGLLEEHLQACDPSGPRKTDTPKALEMTG